jgi:CheY-like chemotaxis protein
MPTRQIPAPGTVSPSARGPDCRPVILLAEDEVQIRRVFRLVLERDGYRVLAAADGQEALTMSRAFSGVIDLLLTDIEMPGMSGLALWECIRRERPETKVLLMSGRASVRGLPFVRKPMTPASLKAAVRELVRAGSQDPGLAP